MAAKDNSRGNKANEVRKRADQLSKEIPGNSKSFSLEPPYDRDTTGQFQLSDPSWAGNHPPHMRVRASQPTVWKSLVIHKGNIEWPMPNP